MKKRDDDISVYLIIFYLMAHGEKKDTKNEHDNHPHHVHHKGHHHGGDGEAHYLIKHEKSLKYKGVEIDPLLVRDNHVAEDYYSLVWCSLKKEVWQDKTFYGANITFTGKNTVLMLLEFFGFLLLLGLTIFILIWETFTSEKFRFANIRIEILRILLVFFAQKLLTPEITKGSYKFRYVRRFPEEFSYPFFASLVSFFQIFMACVNYCCIVLFMCLSDTALPLVMHFAEVAVLIELDDWFGEMICKEFPDEGEKPEDVDITDVNENMGIHSKMSMVREDLRIVNDLNIPYSNWILRIISAIISWFPFWLLPFISTLGFEYLIMYLQPNMIEGSSLIN